MMSSDHTSHCPFFTGDPLIYTDLVVVVKIMSVVIVMEAPGPLHLCNKHERNKMHVEPIKHVKYYNIPYSWNIMDGGLIS